ncbi:MAG: hypothetical protein J0647_06065 [Campylobacteraceae bacterium]|nr:hypothetical protein [Campylobacteraceae bacterium]
MKMLKIILISILLVLSGATSANAMGDREKGALIGASAVVLLGGLIGASQSNTRYVEPRREVIYYEAPRQTVVYREPYYERERVVIINNDYPRGRPHYNDRNHDRYNDRYYYGR